MKKEKFFYIFLIIITLLTIFFIPKQDLVLVKGQDLALEFPNWQIKFNESGTNLKDNKLKVRFDIFPAYNSNSFSTYYVYNIELKEWQLNPILSIFIQIDNNTTKDNIVNYINQKYNEQVLSTLDNTILNENSIHLISPYFQDKTKLSTNKVLVDNSNINTKLSNLILNKNVSINVTNNIIPKSIDIGAEAIERSGNVDIYNFLVISTNNPANNIGSLDTFEIYPINTNGTGLTIGTIYNNSGVIYSSRDYESLGDFYVGSKNTYTGLDCDVEIDDFIGAKSVTGSIYRSGVEGSDYAYYKVSENFNFSSQTFTSWLPLIISLYGTGTETPIEQPSQFIPKIIFIN